MSSIEKHFISVTYDLKVANFIRDEDLLNQVRDVAENYWEHHASLVELLLQRWLEHALQFAKV